MYVEKHGYSEAVIHSIVISRYGEPYIKFDFLEGNYRPGSTISFHNTSDIQVSVAPNGIAYDRNANVTFYFCRVI